MMMTCRLLCALLVLALCCCPSVCAAEPSEKNTVSNTTTTTTTTKSPTTEKRAGTDVKDANTLSAAPGAAPQENDESGKPSLGSSEEMGKSAPGTPGPTAPEMQSNELSNTGQKKGTDGTTEPPSLSDTPADKKENGAEDAAETTTTTTKTPTTTSTTQAPTTTAPEATSTSTTEAPTATTTRAPSRLPEIDGSLSSSAWVCAPLLLAASALAYTTLW
ncbi:mucin TcMUCII, putative [Trypanosoma cruzi marinkellei]|uniref:Mucin TcMUCII, putative n=1 Tax=Trypanosoma cruzi marinkellei TaxID=85056 RepID=K2NJZ6_TRYCR|nr:mucin TcMUCII, putative [Trypanosoma cruzi marinkellei]